MWATTFTLIGYGFSQSFGAAADTLSHGAFALAVVGVAGLAWHHRRTRPAAELDRMAAGVVAVRWV